MMIKFTTQNLAVQENTVAPKALAQNDKLSPLSCLEVVTISSPVSMADFLHLLSNLLLNTTESSVRNDLGAKNMATNMVVVKKKINPYPSQKISWPL